ncbi:MAG: hypothetical protein Greene101415_1071 [Parcubacteria group bacterium Greene1014_15]|nr:MAG: hypothetical protein Greene101415_1071 [Parcubacteria group bacterium Greene1014_15]
MTIRNTKEPLLLFLGDVVLLFAALWIMLLIRYFKVPDAVALNMHLLPFSILIGAWILAFYIGGLYRKHTLLLRNSLPTSILHIQIANSIIAVSFFYFIPYLRITPKINLFIYLCVSSLCILIWRMYGHPLLGIRKKEDALLIGSGEEMQELWNEVNHNLRYSLTFLDSIDPQKLSDVSFQNELIQRIRKEKIGTVVLDMKDGKVSSVLPRFYNLIFSGVRFVDMQSIYEDIFDRVPLSLVGYSWFFENISWSSNGRMYDILKRCMDIFLALILGSIALPLVPLVFALIKLDDHGPVFIVQERMGKNNKRIQIRKFRTMMVDSGGIFSALEGNYERITRVGSFLRKTRIDELPQLWSVFVGDISLIGPRPELPDLAVLYEKEIPYYNVRHLIKPGLSGWAQILQPAPPKFGVGYDTTKIKLSYDLYYIKHRSLMLDVKIALRTVRTLLSRSGL